MWKHFVQTVEHPTNSIIIIYHFDSQVSWPWWEWVSARESVSLKSVTRIDEWELNNFLCITKHNLFMEANTKCYLFNLRGGISLIFFFFKAVHWQGKSQHHTILCLFFINVARSCLLFHCTAHWTEKFTAQA